MAGMEIDFDAIKGRPLTLGLYGWGASLLLGVLAVGTLQVIPEAKTPLMVTLVLCTTGLGILLPLLRDGGHLETSFGRLLIAAGTVGEVGPVVAMSLLLSQRYSTWQEMGFLIAFLVIVGGAIAVGVVARPPKVVALLGRHMQASTQLPIRVALLMLAGSLVLAEKMGFESILGAFAAGLVVGQATRGEDGKPMREKLDAVTFGWFYPFFFVGTGIKFDVPALVQSLTTLLLLPAFLLLFMVIRGAPVLLYRHHLARRERLPFALSLAVPSLSIAVVISEIGLRAKTLSPSTATALIGAGLLAVMLFPTVAGALLSRTIAGRHQ
jgi:Kef-type K+ transport system membrane component KefB